MFSLFGELLKLKGIRELNNRIYKILTLLATSLSLIGCVLFSQVRRAISLESNTTITLSENETATLKADLKDIYPGSENKYIVNLNNESRASYSVSLKFDGGINKGNLDQYLTVTFESESVSFTKLLKEVLSSKETFDMGNNVKHIKLTYLMPSEIGNEAQNSFADFYIDISAKRN